MDRSVKVQRLDKKEGREIFISDIHGNLDAYKRLLALVDYKPGTDRLFLLGDLVEKGPENLETLHFIMDQVKTEDVHCLMGNCDFTAKNVLYSYRLEFLKSVVSKRNSLVTEMADRLGITMDMDMDDFCAQLREHFLPELEFLSSLPHVIVLPDKILTHAGIMDEEAFGSDFRETMTYPFFAEKGGPFSVPVICGHLPVSEYCTDVGDFNPRFDAEKNIWSIDGGNIVKENGQLNAVGIDGDTVSCFSVDDLPKRTVRHGRHPKNPDPFYIPFNHGTLHVVSAGAESSEVYSPYLKREFRIPNHFLKDGKGTDYTNWQMPLEQGDTISLCETLGQKALIKKAGKLGWCQLSDLEPV